MRTVLTRITHQTFLGDKTGRKTLLTPHISLAQSQHKHHARSGRCWDSLSNAINYVITGIKQKIIHLVAVPLRSSVNMLGICVCLCALFTQVASQETEEPISYTVSERCFSVTGYLFSIGVSKFMFTLVHVVTRTCVL